MQIEEQEVSEPTFHDSLTERAGMVAAIAKDMNEVTDPGAYQALNQAVDLLLDGMRFIRQVEVGPQIAGPDLPANVLPLRSK